MSWGASTPGTEGTTITLGTLAATANSLAGDSDGIQSLAVSGVPIGDTLSDGHGHSFTATAGHTSVDVTSWTLSSLTIKTTSDTDFILTATATEVDGDGNTSTATTNEPVTVNPLAPTVSWGASTPGTEGTTIALGTSAATANGLAATATAFSRWQ